MTIPAAGLPGLVQDQRFCRQPSLTFSLLANRRANRRCDACRPGHPRSSSPPRRAATRTGSSSSLTCIRKKYSQDWKLLRLRIDDCQRSPSADASRNSFEKTRAAYSPGAVHTLYDRFAYRESCFQEGPPASWCRFRAPWFPIIDRQPRKSFVPNIFEARESDFQKATQRIFSF